MGKIGLACRAFFRILANREVADQVEQLFRNLASSKLDTLLAAPAPPAKPAQAAAKPCRSEALTLLATLQREARLIDLVQEPLAQFSDQQVGAAAREVLQNCGKVLERAFDLQAVVPQSEGEKNEVPAGFDPASYHLTGSVAGDPPFRGTLAHHGWRATRCQLPQWTGSASSALLLAPAEVELS
jgi:hypothetical protein